MNDLSFNIRAQGKYVIVNILKGDYNSEEFYDHHQAAALAEYLEDVVHELLECIDQKDDEVG